MRPLFLLILFILCYNFLPIPVKAEKKIHIEESFHNFDTIPERQKDFVWQCYYTNDGESPLYITEIIKHCGCTYTQFHTNALAPGQTDSISVYFCSFRHTLDTEQKLQVIYHQGEEIDTTMIGFKAYVVPEEVVKHN